MVRRKRFVPALLTMLAALVLYGCGESKPPLVPDPDPPAASADGGSTTAAAPGSAAGNTAP